MSVKQLDDLLSEYGASHRHPTNKLFHWICVPAIYFSIVGLLMAIPTPFAKHWWFNWASVALFVGVLFFATNTFVLSCGSDGKCPKGYSPEVNVEGECSCINMFGGDDVESVGDAIGLSEMQTEQFAVPPRISGP